MAQRVEDINGLVQLINSEKAEIINKVNELNQNEEINEILTVKEAAAQLKTTRQQIRKMIANGELPAVKVGREWRIPLESIRLFLKENL